MRPLVLSFLAVVSLARAASGAETQTCLEIVSVSEAPDDNFGPALGAALYREAGLCATIIKLPTERLSRTLEKGELDGVVVRTVEFVRTHPELVLVPTPLIRTVGRLYWRKDGPKPQGAGHTVGFPRGWQWPRIAAQTLALEPVEVDDNRSLPKMAEAGRIDGFLIDAFEFENFIATEAERKEFSSADVVNIPLYHTVTRKHVDLVPRLDSAIRQMVARGEINRLLDNR